MRKFLSFLAFSIPLTGNAQVLNNNGATINITSGTTLYVTGNFTNSAGGTLNNNGNLRITGNTVNNGTTTGGGSGNLNLTGTTAQTISGTSPLLTRNVTVNNTAGITLTTPLEVDGAITFNNGLITAASNSSPVIFTANGSIGNTPTDASHINGYVRKLGSGAFIFPVGNATRYQPIGINLSANSAGVMALYNTTDAGTASFGTGGTSATPLVAYNKREYWDVTPVGTATGTVTIFFDGYNNIGIGNTADLKVAHKSGGQWLNEGGTATGTTATGSVTSNNISMFSPFMLGSTSANSPLPVSLVRFSGGAEGSRNRLNWNTATETEDISFEVARSKDGSSFEEIGKISGKGKASDYTFYDSAPLAYRNYYYRLRIVKPSGEHVQSNTVIIRRSNLEGAVVVKPVPAHSSITITTNNTALLGSTVVAMDMQGRVMSTAVVSVSTEIAVQSWPAGIYTLKFEDESVVRIVKQ